MNTRVHRATEQDLAACLALRSRVLHRIGDRLRPEETWCPAGVQIPWISGEEKTAEHLKGSTDDRWAVVLEKKDTVAGCLLIRTVVKRKELVIQGHQPWSSPTSEDKEQIAKLVRFVIAQARSPGMEKVRYHFHGPERQVLPLAGLYRSLGFNGGIRLEMVTRDFDVDPGRRDIRFRTAGEIGEDTFHESEVAVGRFGSIEESKEDCDFSRRMWTVDPDTDWVVAYVGSEPVATTRVAIAKNGTGVVDDVTVAGDRRNEGIGRAVLARALLSLNGRTEAVWADTDEDNSPAIRLNRKLGLWIHHHHGVLTVHME